MEIKEDIYQSIGSILNAIAPREAEKITLHAVIEADDVMDFQFSYIDEKGGTGSFSGGGKANYDFFNLLMRLRNEFRSIHEDEWNSCTFTLNKSGKFNMEFSYDESDSIDF